MVVPGSPIERTLKIVNPANRVLTLNESLTRRGYEPVRIVAGELPTERAALVAEPLFVLVDSAMVGRLGTAELAGRLTS